MTQRPSLRTISLASLLFATAALNAACSDDAETTSGSGGESKTDGAGGDTGGGDAGTGGAGTGGAGGTAAVDPAAPAIGNGDAASVQFVTVFDDDGDLMATDLDFHPTRDELWISLREQPDDTACTQSITAGCFALQGSVAIVTAPASAAPTSDIEQDPNAWHFMRRPSGIAFGEGDIFATIHEFRTGNFTDDPSDFIGPSLWSSDPSIFANEPPGKNGSHIDMLHETPWGMGIVHDVGNVYWTFNGNVGAIDRYDFAEPHEVGGDDHTDGTVRRFVEGSLLRAPEIPSHLALDHATGWLYIADTGNGRVVRLNTLSGTVGAEFSPYEPMVESVAMDGAVLEDVVPTGLLAAPSGLAIAGSGDTAVLYVGDRATGTILAYTPAGVEIARLATDLPGLAGLALGPDGSLYATSYDEGRVVRLVVTPAAP